MNSPRVRNLSVAEHLFLSYSLSIILSLAALGLTSQIKPFFDTHFFEFFQAAVALSAWYGGLGPGLVAAGISFLLIDYYLIHPLNAFVFTGTDFIRVVIFLSVAVLISWLSGRLKKSQKELEEKVEQRTKELSEANKAILEISNREQRRLGQDLHDGLSQILTGVKFMTQSVREELVEQKNPETSKVEKIEAQLKEALTYVDTVSRGLYPVELEANGLESALKEMADKMSKVYSVSCQFLMPIPMHVNDGAVANHIYRIAQEAVINAIKGGKAKKIKIRLISREDDNLLTIIDDGVGYGNAPMRKGMGVKMMEYRARVVDGSLRIKARRKGVTRVSCSFPRRIKHDN